MSDIKLDADQFLVKAWPYRFDWVRIYTSSETPTPNGSSTGMTIMSARRVVPDWLKKFASKLGILVAFEFFRECCRRLVRWVLEE